MTKATSASRSRGNIWLFALLSLVFAYLTLLGTTFNGVLVLLEIQPFTLGLFGFLALFCLVVHWRKKWVWYRTSLDVVLILWGIAFIASIIANPITWRRSVEGLWYMALYVGLWFLLVDALVNGGLSRQILSQSFIFAGFIGMLFGWYSFWLLLTKTDLSTFPRPSGLIGNSNAFGAFMVLLLPFGIAQTIAAQKRFPKIIMGAYSVSVFLLLMLTVSRGAWIGSVVGIATIAFLLLADRNLLSATTLKAWWIRQTPLKKWVAIVVLIVGLILGALMAYYLILSLSAPGRSLSLRTYLWTAAIDMFRDSPLFGKGFYTYGQHLAKYASIPPTQPQAHAHNVPFTIAAEMGLLGLLTLLVTAIVILRGLYRNWKAVAGIERIYYFAGVSATMSFAVHHLLDTPSMMPAIALIGLLILVIAVAPAELQPVQAMWHKFAYTISVLVIWVALIVFGFWHIRLYRDYYAILRDVVALNDCRIFEGDCDVVAPEAYLEPAAAMQAVVDKDPNQPAYVLQLAYIYGMAASEGDADAIERAIEQYRRYLELEPTHTTAWSNLAALYWQAGNQAQARSAIEQALFYAPAWPHFQRQRDIYAGILTDAENSAPPTSKWGLNWSRFQYLREPLLENMEYLPQVGRGS